MAKGDLLGHIDCCVCGYKDGMRITEDKNGDPFGYCESNCDQQLRIGGRKSRVDQFYRQHPNIKRPGEAPPGDKPAAAVPVVASREAATETEQKPAAAPAATPKRQARCLLEA